MTSSLTSPQPDLSQSFTRTPASYPRRVLLAVCGLSPQIVTETLYALAAQEHDPFIPTEVHLITTAEGARRAELSLLSDDLGWFHKLCQDYRLPGITFNRHHIHVMRDAQERGMDDIRTCQDNHDAANFITAQVRHFSADPHCAMHVSIAGRRKTMSFYLGYALSLYGRAQDRLSHVLVSDQFESSWDFSTPRLKAGSCKRKTENSPTPRWRRSRWQKFPLSACATACRWRCWPGMPALKKP